MRAVFLLLWCEEHAGPGLDALARRLHRIELRHQVSSLQAYWCCSPLLRKNRASVRISCRRRKTPDFRPPGVAAALGAVAFSLSGHPVLRHAPLSTPPCDRNAHTAVKNDRSRRISMHFLALRQLLILLITTSATTVATATTSGHPPCQMTRLQCLQPAPRWTAGRPNWYARALAS